MVVVLIEYDSVHSRLKTLCGICNETIDSDMGTIQATGLQRIIGISKDIDDGLSEKLLEISLPINIHRRCRRTYTAPKYIAAKKRKREKSSDHNVKCVRRSQLPQYNPYTDCFYCSKTILYYQNCSKDHPNNYDKKFT